MSTSDNDNDRAFETAARDFSDMTGKSRWGRARANVRFTFRRKLSPISSPLRMSEVLFLEALRVAEQRSWQAFSAELLAHRRNAHIRVVGDIQACAQADSQADEVVTQLGRLQTHVAAIGAAAKPDLEPNKPPASQAVTLLSDFSEVATGLPERLRVALDAGLEREHRRFMALGGEPDPSERVWPPRPIQDEPVPPHALVGLALSGGGIRSASFSAGAIESLSRHGLLRAFDIVSSVSGGGYAAAWVGAWAYRHADGMKGVESELRPSDGIARAPLRWMLRHCSYLAPRRGLAFTGDGWALAAAYLSRWLPILALVIFWLLALLMLPHALLAVATPLVQLGERLSNPGTVPVLAVTAVLTFGLMSLLRRLTLYHRVPGPLPRPSPDLPLLVAGWTVLATVMLAISLPLLHGLLREAEAGSNQITVKGWPLWTAVAIAIVVATSLTSLAAAMLTSGPVQHFIDAFRQLVLSHSLTPAGPLIKHKIPATRWMLAHAVRLAVLTVLLTALLELAGSKDLSSRALVTLGPPAMFITFALAEVSAMAFIAAFLLERDRAWASRLGGWMLAAGTSTALLCGVALWSDPTELAQQYPHTAGAALAMLTVSGLILWRVAGLTVFLNTCLAVLMLWLVALLVVQPLASSFDPSKSLDSVLVTAALAATAFMLGRALDVNRFTLQGIYQEGLVRTFLGASRRSALHKHVTPPADVDLPKEEAQFRNRRADPATDIDDDDDPELYWLRSRSNRAMPLFLLNAAVNGRSLSDVDGDAPRQWPFTFSQYYCGSPAGGIQFAETKDFFTDGGNPSEKGITLGMAMAVSGAALSPISGRLTHPITAFLKAVLNARLGMWIGNPSDRQALRSKRPTPGGTTLLREMLGWRASFAKWIHLSDGGHFENLGLHELLRRGCRRIVVVDGSCDPSGHLTDLAIAFRRARVDLGVHVHRTQAWKAIRADALGKPWAWFEIDYGNDLPRGRLLYVKPSMRLEKPVPVEVLNYCNEWPAFPHESTADQFFSEGQMEAYRLLGRACMDEALAAALTLQPGSATTANQDPALAALLVNLWK